MVHIFSLVCFLIYGVNRRQVLCFLEDFNPPLELLGHDGHVHVPTFGSTSHVSDPKISF